MCVVKTKRGDENSAIFLSHLKVFGALEMYKIKTRLIYNFCIVREIFKDFLENGNMSEKETADNFVRGTLIFKNNL